MRDLVIPRESTQFVEIPVERDGTLVTDFQVAVTRWPARPTSWAAASVVSGKAGATLSGLSVGTYQVWVKESGTVVSAGSVEVV